MRKPRTKSVHDLPVECSQEAIWKIVELAQKERMPMARLLGQMIEAGIAQRSFGEGSDVRF